MIQITKWIEPNEETFYRGTYITNYEWLTIEKEKIARLTGKITTIKTNPDGAKAVFRKRIK